MARRTSLTLSAALSLTTSITAITGVALVDQASARPVVATLATVAAHDAVAPTPIVVRRPAPTRVVVHTAPKPKPTPNVHRPAPRKVRKTAPAVKRTRTVLTPQQLMMRAVDRIPGYRDGDAFWVIKANLGSWGLAAMGGGVVYISPTVPSKHMYDVVSHEWSHLLSVMVYSNDVQTALDAMNAWFGGSDLTGAERAADCMALQLGATWTHYTPCTNAHWRDGARRLLAHQRL